MKPKFEFTKIPLDDKYRKNSEVVANIRKAFTEGQALTIRPVERPMSIVAAAHRAAQIMGLRAVTRSIEGGLIVWAVKRDDQGKGVK